MSQVFQVTGIVCKSCLPHLNNALSLHVEEMWVNDRPASIQFVIKRDVEHQTIHDALHKVDKKYSFTEACGSRYDRFKLWYKTYYPLLLIIAFIALVSSILTVNSQDPSAALWMQSFMSGFFLVFSFFKFLDLRGFARAYAKYDLLAKYCPKYGMIYPFMELGLAIAYITSFMPIATYIFTIVLMAFGGLGVLRVVLKGETLACACLGTTLNLPMSSLTIVENFGMALMAGMMLGLNISI